MKYISEFLFTYNESVIFNITSLILIIIYIIHNKSIRYSFLQAILTIKTNIAAQFLKAVKKPKEIVEYLIYTSKFYYKYFLSTPQKKLKNQKKYVVITGATSGIGREFAFLYSKLGYNLILISRNKDKLTNLKNEILSSYVSYSNANSHIDVVIIEFDFGKETFYKDFIIRLGESINYKYNVSIVINNVGVYDGAFVHINYNDESIYSGIYVNLLSFLYISSFFLYEYKKIEDKDFQLLTDNTNNNQSNHIKFINMSSLSGEIPDFTNAIYSACKRFIKIFSMNYLNSTSICVMPSYIETNMCPVKSNGIRVISSNVLCRCVIGLLGKKRYTSGYFTHSIESFIVKRLPLKVIIWYFQYDLQNL